MITKSKIFLLILSTLLLVLIVFFEPLRFIDNLFYDLNFAFSPKAAGDAVVVVAFDTKSLSAVGGWPWSRAKLAEVIEKINALNPRVIALDIILPKRENKEDNRKLASAISHVKNCIIPFRAIEYKKKPKIDPLAVPASIYVHRFLRLKNQEKLDNINFYQVEGFEASDTLFSKYSRYSGFINVSTSNTSQKLREIIHVVRAGNEYYPSFALAAAAAYLELKPEDFMLDGTAKVWLDKKQVPISTHAATLSINFRSDENPIITISALDILNGSVSRELVDGKLVFVGVDDPAAGSDFFITPIASQYPGVKLWATAALDIFENAWVIKGGGLFALLNWLMVFLIFPGLAILDIVSKRQIGVYLGLGFLIISIAISYLLFQQYNYFWNPAHHIYAWIFSLIWLALIKPEGITKLIEALQLEPSEELAAETLEPPLKSYILSEVPHTITANYVINTIIHDTGKKIPWESAKKAEETEQLTDDEMDTIDLSHKKNAAKRKKVITSPAVSESEIVEFQKLCNGKIVNVLGSGGMADVYLVWNPRLEVYRAVKVLKPDLAKSYADRFETEIRIFSKLNHPNIVHCYGVGEWHSLPFVEMEYVNGASLDDFIRKCGALTMEQAAIIGILICRALNYAHHHVVTIYGKTYNGVIHRDLKPANVLLSRIGKVKLTDFGIARPASVSLHTQNSGNIVGTMPYLSPEQLDGKAIDAQTDIYALGITLYELLMGKRAFPQKDMTALIQAKSLGKIDVPLNSVTRIPRALVDIVNKAIETNKEYRYRDVKELGRDLENFIRSHTERSGYTHLQELIHKFWS